ncbi:hypothetical protein FS837_001309 [Tulasnella sp. UAMH 9824]|nr:hypothetical protein FS837_001309 [Tulasnella sp. UAMH 9824]
MQLSSHQTLFRLCFLTPLRALLAGARQLLRVMTSAIGTSTPPLRYEPETDAPAHLGDPPNDVRYVDQETSTSSRKPLPGLPQTPCVDEEIPDFVNATTMAMSHGDAQSSEQAIRGAKFPTELSAFRSTAALNLELNVDLPTLDLVPLTDGTGTLERALILAWLVHFYVHSTSPSLSKEIAVPTSISRHVLRE